MKIEDIVEKVNRNQKWVNLITGEAIYGLKTEIYAILHATRMSNIQVISSYKKSHPDASTSLWSLLNRCPHALIRRTGFMDSPGCIVPRTRVRNYQKSTQWHHIKWMKNIPQVYQQIYLDYKTILHVLDWHASEYIEQSDSSAMICPLKNFV